MKDGRSKEPKYLYKYRELNLDLTNQDNVKKLHWVEKIFTHNELYFSSPLSFNDPFDCKAYLLFFAGSSVDVSNWFDRKYQQYFPGIDSYKRQAEITRIIMAGRYRDIAKLKEMETELQAQIDNGLGVFCLTEKPDDILMWSHYSGSHTGFCLEFDRNNPFFARAEEVKYQLDFPDVNFYKSLEKEQIESVLFTKARFWEYEKEWRIVEPISETRTYPFPEEALTGVVLGCNISYDGENRIREWIAQRTHRPVLYKAKRKQGAFGLNIEPI